MTPASSGGIRHAIQHEGSRKQMRAERLAQSLALRGHMQSPSKFFSNEKPYCDKPRWVYAGSDPKSFGRPLEAGLWTPCRKCPRCLQFRRLYWLSRMEWETGRPGRTWFLTLTFDPIELAKILAEAMSTDPLPGGVDAAVDAAAYRRVQLYLKRLRKSGARFRYVFVFERGSQTGRPHYHALVHENGSAPITYRTLCDAWPYHAHAKLVGGGVDVSLTDRLKAVRYVAKYIGKVFGHRPRASRYYGSSRKLTSVSSPLAARTNPRLQRAE